MATASATPAAARPTGASWVRVARRTGAVPTVAHAPALRNALRTRSPAPARRDAVRGGGAAGHSRSPSSVSAAGAMNIRTSVMSTRTALASPMPVILITGSGSVAKPMKTAIMIAPAAAMILRVPAEAAAIAARWSGCRLHSSRTREMQEHVVVRREPEQDREHEQRHVGDDRQLLDAEQARARLGLERERDHAVGGGDREQVEQRRQHRRSATSGTSPAGAAATARRRRPRTAGSARRSSRPRRRSARCGRRRRRVRPCPAARPGSSPRGAGRRARASRRPAGRAAG